MYLIYLLILDTAVRNETNTKYNTRMLCHTTRYKVIIRIMIDVSKNNHYIYFYHPKKAKLKYEILFFLRFYYNLR